VRAQRRWVQDPLAQVDARGGVEDDVRKEQLTAEGGLLYVVRTN
jgi:hypothetical protein